MTTTFKNLFLGAGAAADGNADYEAFSLNALSASMAISASDLGYQDGDYICRGWGFADADSITLTSALLRGGAGVNATNTGASIVPVLTANNDSSGWVASASTEYNANWAAWKAFDSNPTTTGWDSNGVLPQWLRLQAPSVQPVAAYGLTAAPSVVPTAWTFQGSSDGATWVDLDTRTGQTVSTTVLNTYTLSAPAFYRYYRLYVTAGGSGLQVAVTQFALFAAVANAAAITGNSYAVSGAPTKGRILLRATNNDGSGMIDLGNSASNQVELYQSINGNSTWSAALAVEGSRQISGSKFDIWTPEFDMTAATGIGFKLQSFARSVAPNFAVDHVIFLGRAA